MRPEDADEFSLQNQLEFEQLLSKLATTFVSVPAEEIDAHIEAALRAIVEFLDLDRGNVFRIQPEALVHVQHSWSVGGVERFRHAGPLLGFPWIYSRLQRGETVVFTRPEELPPEAAEDRESMHRFGTRSNVSIPLTVGGTLVGALALGKLSRDYNWRPEVVQRLQILGGIIANAMARKQKDLEMREALARIERLRDRLSRENSYLRAEIARQHRRDEIIGRGKAVAEMLERADRVGKTASTVLLLGETGTGKELLARAIHGLSSRSDRPMVKVNCAALPASLVESELFGREKGAYTGALTAEVGRFELAHGSTIFLDEIGELPLELQAKLLRVLQEGEFERLGSAKTIKVDARVIAATNRDLAAAVRDKTFRADLYYRLNVFPIVVPPLRERREDIPPLVWAFVREFADGMGKLIETIPEATMQALTDYDWPGNVRELRNVIERAIILSRGEVLEVELPNGVSPGADADSDATLEELMRRHIRRVLEMTAGRVRGSGGAAELLGVNAATLDSRMQRLGIRRARAQ